MHWSSSQKETPLFIIYELEHWTWESNTYAVLFFLTALCDRNIIESVLPFYLPVKVGITYQFLVQTSSKIGGIVFYDVCSSDDVDFNSFNGIIISKLFSRELIKQVCFFTKIVSNTDLYTTLCTSY